jgi:3',5'-cyclic AMP phosphodiesterase CpdA
MQSVDIQVAVQLRHLSAALASTWIVGLIVLFAIWAEAHDTNSPAKHAEDYRLRSLTKRLALRLAVATFVLLPVLAAVPAIVLGLPPKDGGGSVFMALLGYIALLLVALYAFGRVEWIQNRFRLPWVFAIATLHTAVSVLLIALPFGLTISQARIARGQIPRISPAEPLMCSNLSTRVGANEEAVLVAHLSDLHLVRGDQKWTQDGSRPGNAHISALIRLVNQYHPKYLIVSGDITDAGAGDEWQAAEQALSVVRPATQVVLSPGNHDFSLAFEIDQFQQSEAWRLQAGLRLPRFLETQARLNDAILTAQGISVADLVRRAPVAPSSEAIRRAVAVLEACVAPCTEIHSPEPRMRPLMRAECSRRCRAEPGRDLKALDAHENWYRYWKDASRQVFPLIQLDHRNRAALISLASSTKAGDTIGENAIGRMDDEQLHALRDILRGIPTDIETVFLVYHHPITAIDGETESASLTRILTGPKVSDSLFWADAFLRHDTRQAEQIGTLLEEELSARPRMRGFFVFGHRHRRTLGVRGPVTFVEAPNAASDEPGVYFIGQRSPQPYWCAIR